MSVRRFAGGLLAVVTLFCVVACYPAQKRDSGGRLPVAASAVYGSWKGGGGQTAEFRRDGVVLLSGVSCLDFSPSGVGREKEIDGRWEIKRPNMGGEHWVSVTLSRDACGLTDGSESGFYVLKEKGKVVLHLGDPGMAESRLNFFKIASSGR